MINEKRNNRANFYFLIMIKIGKIDCMVVSCFFYISFIFFVYFVLVLIFPFVRGTECLRSLVTRFLSVDITDDFRDSIVDRTFVFLF